MAERPTVRRVQLGERLVRTVTRHFHRDTRRDREGADSYWDRRWDRVQYRVGYGGDCGTRFRLLTDVGGLASLPPTPH